MKKLYTLAFMAFATFASQAQNLTFTTPQHIDEELVNAFSTFDIVFTTETPQDVTFEWTRISNTMPSGWDMSLCDYTACYIGIPPTGTMTPITQAEAANGTKGFFKLTVQHMNVVGEGVAELYVYDSNDPLNGDTVSYTLSFGNVSVAEMETASPLTITPNPATDQVNFAFDGALNGAIYTANGQKVMNVAGEDQFSVNMNEMPAGIYIVRLQDVSGAVITERITKI